MNASARDVRNVTIGLLTGAALVVAMGQAPAKGRQGQQAQPELVQRFQITAGRDAAGNEVLFVLDHHTQKVHRAGTNINADGTRVSELAQIRD
jgi:hypothetical protein